MANFHGQMRGSSRFTCIYGCNMVNCGRNVANGTRIVAEKRQFPNVSGDLGGSVEKKK